MKSKISILISLMVISTMILSACGGGGGATEQKEVTFWHAYGTGSAEEMEFLKRFHRYYQGPVPAAFEGKFPPAPRYDSEPPAPNC